MEIRIVSEGSGQPGSFLCKKSGHAAFQKAQNQEREQRGFWAKRERFEMQHNRIKIFFRWAREAAKFDIGTTKGKKMRKIHSMRARVKSFDALNHLWGYCHTNNHFYIAVTFNNGCPGSERPLIF